MLATFFSMMQSESIDEKSFFRIDNFQQHSSLPFKFQFRMQKTGKKLFVDIEIEIEFVAKTNLLQIASVSSP